MIVGNSATSGGSISARGIDAADPPIKKSMFCIDNVNPHYSVAYVVNFVSNLHVTVVSCFEVKPRRRYSDYGEDPIARKAFRLCIHSKDSDLLLDASKWPARVAIYDYFFKKKNHTNSKSNEHESWQGNLQDKSHSLGVFGLARSEPFQFQSPLPLAASVSALPSSLVSGNNELNEGDIDIDKEIDSNVEDTTDMDATILTPYSPGMNTSTLNMTLTQSTDHGAI